MVSLIVNLHTVNYYAVSWEMNLWMKIMVMVMVMVKVNIHCQNDMLPEKTQRLLLFQD